MSPLQRLLAAGLLAAPMAFAAAIPDPVDGEAVLKDFRFSTGEVLPEVRIHYFTLGRPARDASGRIANAVLLLHGTNGQGGNFLAGGFAGELFGAGQPLDASRWFLVVPDSIGHGRSTRPSSGLRGRFPRYGYRDMVNAQHRLVTEVLGIDHLRLIVGTSMGGMHAWMWAEAWPDFMEAVLPLACLPAQVSGRNRMERRLIADAIRNDPQWRNGDYEVQPPSLATALQMIHITGGSARQFHAEAPTLEATDRLFDQRVSARLKGADANDLLYAWEASWDYDPAPGLEAIRAAVTAVNFADDARNPPELGIFEREVARVPRGRAVTVPAGERTRGHASFHDATLWKEYLVELLERSNPAKN
ncbi:MAG TPA: alpha/beta fold hydrolase [Burkholderiales bacterium]|nr:alpha/beta fold hydrolase [Burkholderiales bacterium]